MDEQVEDGNAFAIPDLWKESTLARFDDRTTDFIALGFEPLSTSTSLSPKNLSEGLSANILRQIFKMKTVNNMGYRKTCTLSCPISRPLHTDP